MSPMIKVALWLAGLPTALVALIVAKVLAGQVLNALRYRLAGCNIPAAPEKPFYGSRTKKPFHQERLDDFKNMGPIFYSSIFNHPSITVGDPELIQYVLLKENFPKSPSYERLKAMWGDSIVTMQHGKDGPWKDHRHLVNPAFKLSAIRALHRVFVDKSVDLAERLDRYAATKEAFDFQADISLLTMDIISASGFGHDLGAIKGKTKDPFFVALQGIFERIKHPFVFLGLTSLVNHMARHERGVVRDLFNKIIDERIKQRQERTKKEEDKDILDIFLDPAEDGRQMSREQIHHELFIFYLAGHETTATTLSWTLYLLTQNPDVEEKLFQEVESVMGPPTAGKVKVPTAAEVEEMPYMTMVLNESLRLFPPATAVVRVIPETFEYKGFIFPKGVEIASSPLVTHHNPEIWPNPEKFDPDRFSKENSAGRHLCAFMPFSAGQRICLGRNFFYEEAKTILATMLLNYKFHADPTRESGTMTSNTTLRPNAVWVSVTKRAEA